MWIFPILAGNCSPQFAYFFTFWTMKLELSGNYLLSHRCCTLSFRSIIVVELVRIAYDKKLYSCFLSFSKGWRFISHFTILSFTILAGKRALGIGRPLASQPPCRRPSSPTPRPTVLICKGNGGNALYVPIGDVRCTLVFRPAAKSLFSSPQLFTHIHRCLILLNQY